MAKENKRSALKIGLVLDASDMVNGLKDARAKGQAEGNAINVALSDVANKVAARFFSVQAAIGLAKKGYKEFVDAAGRLEKQGRGNEGTAAIARISAAVDRMQESFVKAVLETGLMRSAVTGLASAAEAGALALTSWANAADVAAVGVRGLASTTLNFLADTASSTTSLGAAVRSMLGSLPVPGAGLLGAAASGAAGFNAATGGGASDGLRKMAADQVAASKEAAGRLREELAKQTATNATAEATSRAGQFGNAKGSVVDAFVGSWESGFARLGDLFRGFSADVSKSLGGMAQSTTAALGDTFESVAFLGPQLQRVYGQSAAGAARFQAAQLALVGALAVVKAAMASAEAADLISTDPAGAAAKIGAAVAYAGAAALAGVSAARTLGAGSRGGGVGIGSPESFGQERRGVTVVLQNAVGGEEFVRREVIPELNRAVRGDVVLLSTNAQSAGSLQPGRY